mgnify:FL=1
METITIPLKTTGRHQLQPVTALVVQAIQQRGWCDGVLTIFVPHTTAAVTINENADPDVARDMTGFWDQLVPNVPTFRHAEGNTPAHILSSLVGCSLQLLVVNGTLVLGTWQGVYFCEFDGPRTRTMVLGFQ